MCQSLAAGWLSRVILCAFRWSFISGIDERTGLPIRNSGDVTPPKWLEEMNGHNQGVRAFVAEVGYP
jgi:hypothetical protein